MHVSTHDDNFNVTWSAPYIVSDIDSVNFVVSQSQVQNHMSNGVVVPFDFDALDSITYSVDPFESKDPYKVFQIYVNTVDGEEIVSKTEYLDCYVSWNALGSYSDFSMGGKIRGRGNSTWLWYPKKAYRIKLNDKHKVLGLDKSKTWVLLANYRDVTDLMNTFVFQCGQWLNMPFTNHTRYVELILNGKYNGIYQLTEQVQQGKNRVEVDDNYGVLIGIDADDGPSLSPDATDNFWSDVYDMPVVVKYPDDETVLATRKSEIQDTLAILEQAIADKNFQLADSLMDMKSYMHYLMLQELIENVEMCAPRSVYMYKDADKVVDGQIVHSKWFMGPLWDFDAGYDFDWNNMETSHNYFADYRELIFGTDPYKHTGCYDRGIPAFFTNLFGCKEFVKMYKDEWNSIKDSLISSNWAVMEKYVEALKQGSIEREMETWHIEGKNFDTEVQNLKKWLTKRVDYLTQVINNYPEPADEVPTTSTQDCGSMDVTVTATRAMGYSQFTQINVDQTKLKSLLGVSAFNTGNIRSIVPLDIDGEEGENHTNGNYGAWFDVDGDTGYWAEGHVFIEISDDLLNWSFGIHPDNCISDTTHTVKMQIQYADGAVLKTVTVNVKVDISDDWNRGGWTPSW